MEADRVAATNPGVGANIVVTNQCGTFGFNLVKVPDPRSNTEALAEYNHNLATYVGARNWNNFKCKQDYTSNAQLKFSNIKIPDDKFLIDMKWWIDYKDTLKIINFLTLVRLMERSVKKKVGSWD